MSCTTKPIPSKHALKALRYLALSPATAVVGTVSGACSLAALHYQACYTLRRAEQIVDTKRTLYTLSRGKGTKQLNRMIEAAERGEDFTLHHGRPMRQQKRATSIATSTVTSAKNVEELDPRDKPGYSVQHKGNSEAAKTFEHVLGMARDTQSIAPVASDDLPVDMRDIQGSSEQLLMLRHDYKDVALRALIRRQQRKWQLFESNQRISTPLGRQNLYEQEVTDLNPVPTGKSTVNSPFLTSRSQSLLPEESLFFNFVFGKQSRDDVFSSSIFQKMHPWDQAAVAELASTETASREDSSTVNGEIEEQNRELDSAYIAPNAPVPDEVFTHNLTSIYHSLHENILHVAHNGAERYFYTFNTIAQKIHDSGVKDGFLKFEKALITYTRSDQNHDLNLAKLLIWEFDRHFESKYVMAAVRKIVREKLQGDQPNLKFVRLLYASIGDRSARARKYGSYLAMRYLEDFGRFHPDVDDQKAELIKIIEGTRLCDAETNEQLLLPLVRFLCGRGEVQQAQLILDEMQSRFNMRVTLYTYKELMRGYATIGNWWMVKDILRRADADQMMWKRSRGSARLFAESLEQHMATHTIEESCAFVMHAIDHTGLLPTGVISCCVILGCLRERRYDLVRQYVNLVQRDFPWIDLGARHVAFATDAAAVWRDIDATSEDILEGCKAIAVNAIREPFSNDFRDVVSELITKQLDSKIKALESRGDIKLSTIQKGSKVSDLVRAIRELVQHHHRIGFTAESRLLAADLVKQTKVMMEIEALFSGSFAAVRTASEDNPEQQAKSKSLANQQTRSKLPSGLRAFRLPQAQKIVEMLQTFYESRRDRGLPIDHAATQFVCTRLGQQSRHADACSVLEVVYNSEWAQAPDGKPFDNLLFIAWLRLAFRVKSARRVKDIIWAIVESNTEFDISTEMMLIAKAALSETHYTSNKTAHDSALDEAHYLYSRLRWRRDRQLHKADSQNMTFATWSNMGTF